MCQIHRGIKGVVRDKDTEAGIADAIIKVDDIDHHIRSGSIRTLVFKINLKYNEQVLLSFLKAL